MGEKRLCFFLMRREARLLVLINKVCECEVMEMEEEDDEEAGGEVYCGQSYSGADARSRLTLRYMCI